MNKYLKQQLKDIKIYLKKVGKTETSARKFLLSTGIYTPTGRLKKEYK